jgi:hypothetical protein
VGISGLSRENYSRTEEQNCQLGKIFIDNCSENHFRRDNPQVVSIPQLSKKTGGIQPPKTFQKECTNKRTSLYPLFTFVGNNCIVVEKG